MMRCAQVLLEFPIEVLSALVAGRWAASASAAQPFLAGYKLRLGMAAVVTALVPPPSCALSDLSTHPLSHVQALRGQAQHRQSAGPGGYTPVS